MKAFKFPILFLLTSLLFLKSSKCETQIQTDKIFVIGLQTDSSLCLIIRNNSKDTIYLPSYYYPTETDESDTLVLKIMNVITPKFHKRYFYSSVVSDTTIVTYSEIPNLKYDSMETFIVSITDIITPIAPLEALRPGETRTINIKENLSCFYKYKYARVQLCLKDFTENIPVWNVMRPTNEQLEKFESFLENNSLYTLFTIEQGYFKK
jgi:hypothetical protein